MIYPSDSRYEYPVLEVGHSIRRPVTRLVRRYVGSVAAIAALVLTSQILFERRMDPHTDDASMINLAGRQRMLSERMAKSALVAATADQLSLRRQALIDLERSLRDWELAHDRLRDAARSFPAIARAFDSIEPQHDALLAAGQRILGHAGEPEALAGESRVILEEEASFVEKMEGIVSLFEQQHAERTRRTRALSRILSASVLLILVLATAGIFVPGLRDLHNQLEISLFRSSLDLLCVAGRDGCFKRINPAFGASLGYDEADLLGRSFTAIVHPEDRESTLMLLEGLFAGRESASFENRCLCKSGDIKWLHWTASAVPAQGLIFASAREVTARRRADEVQRQLQAMVEKAASEWRLTFDTVRSPILLVDLNGRLKRMNRAAEQLADRPYREALGKPLRILGSEEPWTTIFGMVESSGKGGDAPLTRVQNGVSGRSWEVCVSAARGPSSKTEGIVIVASDVTELMKLQESLRASQVMSTMGTLVGGFAHEVRTPLFALSASIDAFEARFGRRVDFGRYLQVWHAQIGRMSALVHDFLEYGRQEGNDLALASLRSTVEEAIHLCAAMARLASVHVEAEVSNEEWTMPIRRTRLVLAFKNLIENAIHHSPSGDTVRITARSVTEPGRQWVEISVRDHGPGFGKSDLERAFEPFFTTRARGTGLGLTLVKRIVEEHHGSVVAANSDGGGAIVSVRLPLALPGARPV